MTVAEKFANAARQHLRSILHLSGEVLYSSAPTLRPGRVYLLGHNPGGSPEHEGLPTIGSSLDALPTKIGNNYEDGRDGSRRTSPLQVRVKWLLNELGLQTREVAASNLIFPRSRNAKASEFGRFAELCWPVHEEMLTLVQPRLVIVFGNSGRSPYSFLTRKYKLESDSRIEAGHGHWACRSFAVPGRFRVIGLPHLSWYKISNYKDVVPWIKSFPAP